MTILSSSTSAVALLLLTTPSSIIIHIASAQSKADPNAANHKYHFFCGSSFADIQADTCEGRQWCPSSSDDECVIPGHTCFANTPCDARLMDGINVPTYSLSLNPEYNDPTDKMFCGTDYVDALATCEAGGEDAKARHCPDLICAIAGMSCFIDMPCSYYVISNPLSNPLADVNNIAITETELELPDPGTELSTTFCGPTFQQAAADCSSATWCRNGNSQECPNGQTCFTGVNIDNPECEINAITKKESEAAGALADEGSFIPTISPKPITNAPLSSTDPKNQNFCGLDWANASENCALAKHCPNGDADCTVEGETCHTYTTCNAQDLTGSPVTPSPTPVPEPTENPTTDKPSRKRTGEPTKPQPTNPPSYPPTHAPLKFGDFRREFWCGLSYFDALENCAMRCPSGGDDECATHPIHGDISALGLKCLSGVTDCKTDRGFAVYGLNETVAVEKEVNPMDLNGDGVKDSSMPVMDDEIIDEEEEEEEEEDSETLSDAEAGVIATTDTLTEAPSPAPSLLLQGPFEDQMVRIVLYGINSTILTNNPTSMTDQWRSITETYMEDFFNKYPTGTMINSGKAGHPDEVRLSVFDVSVTISGESWEEAPAHDFAPLAAGEVEGIEVDVRDAKDDSRRRNLRRSDHPLPALHRRAQDEIKDSVMVTYTQTSTYRSSADIDDPNEIIRRPLETSEYRADYVTYLRSRDFADFGDLEYVSAFMFSEFPTASPTQLTPVSDMNTPDTTLNPTEPGTKNFGCNLCRPGQIGVNADITFNGEEKTCVDIYSWFLEEYRQGSLDCQNGQMQLSSSCCADPDEPIDVDEVEADETTSLTPSTTSELAEEVTEPPTPDPTIDAPDFSVVEDDEYASLPEVTNLFETYFCGKDWDTVSANCETATPCPSGEGCPSGEACIAYTNCGGKYSFVSDPSVEGGGPKGDVIQSTFYCGTSKQFLEMKCDNATPCPNGPSDCEGDGEDFGCFAFTGCNAEVDPGSFVGFLAPPDEDDVDSAVPQISGDTDNFFYCSPTWEELDSKCVDGVPSGATPCPSGDMLECDEGEGCFAFACNGGVVPATKPAQSPSSPADDFAVDNVNTLKSTFFCGRSVEEIDGDCENAKPCPSGDECPEGMGCFAFSQCGGVDIDSLVDQFGRTDRPSRAPTPAIEQICDEQRKMSVNVGYWQSWSIYRDKDCQQMTTTEFDGGPYTHVVYSFASIDSSYKLEAWNGTYDHETPLFKEFNTVKQRFPGTKTMIAVGGWTHNDPGPMQNRFSQMAGSRSNRIAFASSVVQFLRTYGFDGLDLDWEYPGLNERGGKREDYDNYVLLVKELRSAFNSASEPYELTIAIPGNITKLEMGFDLVGLAEHVDWFNIMAYDLWGSWDPKKVTMSHTDIRMIDEAVDYMSHFIQRSKLVLGLGSYARTYELADDDCDDLMCPFKGPGKGGCEGTDGFLPYFEIADLVTSRGYDSLRFDEETQSMVMITDGNRLISYDNTVSFNRKIEYATDMCMMGQMLWAIDMLKDGSNPLTKSNGNTLATGTASDQSFCGTDIQDVINGCKQPCPSGDSSQCPPGQQCFANTGCNIDNIGSPPPTMCRLCPDPSTQGMREWLEIEFDGESMTCADADMSVISLFATGTDECDSAKDTLASTCCFNYPENPCMLCRTETEFMDLRALGEIEYEGTSMTCADLSKRLGPEEFDGEMCSAAQSEYFDQCCYHQCTLCDQKGVKWWNEVEYEEKPLNCGELDSVLYNNETEVGDEMCTDIVSEFEGECCYVYPDDPCDICSKDGKKHTLMPNEAIEYGGSNFTCAEVNNFLSPFESASSQCSEVRDLSFESCCFDRCSLCGEGSRMDPDVLAEPIEKEGGDENEDRFRFLQEESAQLKLSTCGDIESSLFQEKTTDGSETCNAARAIHYDSCCFKIPSAPCQLCAATEHMHHTTMVVLNNIDKFNGDEITCRSAANFLQEREEMSSETCTDIKAEIGETCCYSTCNLCGEYDLDWDVFVNYNGTDMSCGDFNEIFRTEATIDGSQQCDALKAEYAGTCCYDSPKTSCQLCKQGDTYFDINDNAQVDFNGPTTCFEVANFLSRRLEDTDPVCGVTQTSLFEECCYDRCDLVKEPGMYPDWTATVEMDGNVATCLELDDAIKESAISQDSSECKSLQDAFSSTCSYSPPINSCDICPESAVSVQAFAQWQGNETKCTDINTRLSTREEADGDVCLNAMSSLTESCCIDQCLICDKSQEIDPVLTVYHNGKTKTCADVDQHFFENSVLASSDECTKANFPECCYTPPETPCNVCKKGSEYFDIMGSSTVTFMDQKMACADVSDMLARREEEDGETCSAAKSQVFDACCNSKCSLCADQGLDAGVMVSFEGRMMTCLELDLGLGPAAIVAGSEQCTEITSQHAKDCCYEKPVTSCRICPGETSGVNKQVSVSYLGVDTSCESLSNFLGSREEQDGAACQAATSDHSDECCFEMCSLCDGGKADWETFVTYEGKSIACGDFEWILKGKSIAAGSDQCDAVKGEFQDKCCYAPPTTSCNLCHISLDYLDVAGEVPITYQGSQIKCQNLYNSLFVREAADSEQCQAAKDEHGESCCFKKCALCESGAIDTSATVNVNGTDVSCSALEMSFTADVIEEGSTQCTGKRSEYAAACCFITPSNPCKVCPTGSDVKTDVSVDFYGETKSCTEINTRLASSEEAGSETCSATQLDFSDDCCFERCPICPDGFNLNWEVDVEYNKATIACGEFDGIISGNAIQTGTQECESIRSTFTSACCYNYATATGATYAGENTVAEVTTTGFLSTNLDMSALSSSQKEDAKNVFQNLIKSTLEAEGVLPKDSTVTVTEIDDNGVVQYEIMMSIDDSVIGSVGPGVNSTVDSTSTSEAVIESYLSDPSNLEGAANAIKSEAQSASDIKVAAIMTAVDVIAYRPPGAMTSPVSTNGILETNLNTSNMTAQEKEEVIVAVEDSLVYTLQKEGVLSQGDTVNVTDIVEEGLVLVSVVSKNSTQIVQSLSKPTSLATTAEAVKTQAPGASNVTVANLLAAVDVISFKEAPSSTDGILDTNLNTSNMTAQQKEEVMVAVEDSLVYTLQKEGVLSQGDTVNVTDISEEGLVLVSVVSKNSTQIVQSLSKPTSLATTAEAVKTQASGASNVAVANLMAAVDVISFKEVTKLMGPVDVIPSDTSVLQTNIDTANLTVEQKEEVRIAVESAIVNKLEAAGLISDSDMVTVSDIDNQGGVLLDIDLNSTPQPPNVPSKDIQATANAVVSKIDTTLQNTTTLQTISNNLQAGSAASSVAKELSNVDVTNHVQGETSTTTAVAATTGSGPCNLCNTGEIGLEKQIQFNGASTTCSQVYKFLATQEEAGSDACTAGKDALHKDCCMKKCDLCSNGGIPDWYAMVEVNGKSMTCLALDGIVTESRIQSGSDQCSQLLEVAAPACCYVPPTEPCNICNNGFGFNDVKSSVSVEYGGTNATCGQIFNTLFSREEQESETCSLISNDLASKCCYDQCSLCGDLQTDPALSVTHDGTKMGCGEFDSYIFSSNLIEEGSNECKAFQTEHRPTCCYDVACSLCAKGDEVYTTKEAVMVQYGGSQATCGEVANFLYEQEMSQSNVCLTAQKDIMSSCCFQQCEICDVGTSINWAATTMFNTKEQSCTDIYWTLISESVEAGTEACNGLSQVTKDCCYKAPSQQCTLCKDDNGATYNTRWNTEVTVNGMTKTCGEYNSLLATQENDSTTCSMAKEAIFNDCCFAGSDSLVEVANQLSQAEADDVPCSLCKAGQIGLDAEIVFNNKPTTCEEVHTFLISGFQDISTTCKSAQAALIGDCCREPGDLLPSDKPAFGANSTVGVDGEGSVMAEGPSGEKIIPPMEFETWSRKPINASGNASLGKVCTAALAVLAFVLCMFN